MYVPVEMLIPPIVGNKYGRTVSFSRHFSERTEPASCDPVWLSPMISGHLPDSDQDNIVSLWPDNIMGRLNVSFYLTLFRKRKKKQFLNLKSVHTCVATIDSRSFSSSSQNCTPKPKPTAKSEQKMKL